MATIGSISKSLLSMFGKVAFALLSFFVLLFLCTLFFVGLGVGLGMGMGQGGVAEAPEGQFAYSYISGDQHSENKLAQISIHGVILGSVPLNVPPAFLLDGVTYGYAIQDTLKKIAKDDSIKGVFLYVQSPGGTIFGSYAIFEGIKAYQEQTGKPVLAYIEGLSASGGVMAMVGADEIYADYGSMIGSIGVLGPQLLYYDRPIAIDGGLFSSGIVTEGGIEHTMIHAGRGKDLGNPFRKITEEELQTWQDGINAEYDNFVRHVAENRTMNDTVIRDQMGAQIFDNTQAEAFGLIDGTLNRNASLAKLAELAEIGENFQLVRPIQESGRFLAQLLQMRNTLFPPSTNVQQIVQHSVCEQTYRASLVYYGDISHLCR